MGSQRILLQHNFRKVLQHREGETKFGFPAAQCELKNAAPPFRIDPQRPALIFARRKVERLPPEEPPAGVAHQQFRVDRVFGGSPELQRRAPVVFRDDVPAEEPEFHRLLFKILRIARHHPDPVDGERGILHVDPQIAPVEPGAGQRAGKCAGPVLPVEGEVVCRVLPVAVQQKNPAAGGGGGCAFHAEQNRVLPLRNHRERGAGETGVGIHRQRIVFPVRRPPCPQFPEGGGSSPYEGILRGEETPAVGAGEEVRIEDFVAFGLRGGSFGRQIFQLHPADQEGFSRLEIDARPEVGGVLDAVGQPVGTQCEFTPGIGDFKTFPVHPLIFVSQQKERHLRALFLFAFRPDREFDRPFRR